VNSRKKLYQGTAYPERFSTGRLRKWPKFFYAVEMTFTGSTICHDASRDAKALEIIAQGVELQHQTKIRLATRNMPAWSTLREYYNHNSLHNHVTITCRLHELKMDNGSTMTKNLDAFDELVVGLQTLGEPNAKDVALNYIKDKPLKDYKPLEKKETTESAFKVNAERLKGVRQMKRDCPKLNGVCGNDEVFMVSETQTVVWLIDGDATAYMTPRRADLFEYEALNTGIDVIIADDKKLRVVGSENSLD
ncbi:polyprotein, partial [Phytophthora megakarya]